MSTPQVTAIVPARAGSKGLVGKNLRALGLAPLLVWSIRTAKAAAEIERVVVSTDGADIAACARREGAEVIERPAELSKDDSTVTDLIHHLIAALPATGPAPDIIVYLEPTAPFRTTAEITACLNRLAEGADSAATFAPEPIRPSWLFERERDGALKPLAPGPLYGEPAYRLNGGVYAFKVDAFRRQQPPSIFFGQVAGVEVGRERMIDIDDAYDLQRAKVVLPLATDPEFVALGLAPAPDCGD